MTVRDSKPQGPLFLVDAMSLAYRAYFASPAQLSTKTGIVTNALYGFASMLVNIVRDHKPGSIGVAFDLPGQTFRHELVTDYKGGRAETPGDLLPQFDMIRRLLGALNLTVVQVPGFEADDVLATLATEARDLGRDAVVVTGDRDCYQLVEDPHIRVLYNRKGVSDYSLYDEAGIFERTGVTPVLYPELAAMRGDPSDNLPGVPGVGEKTAARLLTSYGSLDGIYAHLDELTPKLRANLAEHEGRVRANATAIPLVRTVELPVGPADLVLGGWDLDTLRTVYEDYELRTLWQRTAALLIDGAFGPPSPQSAVLEPVGSPATPAPVATGIALGERDDAGGDTPASIVLDVTVVVAIAEEVEVLTPESAQDARSAVHELGAHWPDGAPPVTGAPDSGVALLSVAGRWAGTPGRSELLGLVLARPDPPGHAVWLDAGLLADPGVGAAVTSLLGRAPVVGHGMKELLRSLLPLGLDCTSLAVDTEVVAYLLDPSTGDYGLSALTRRVADAAISADEGAAAAPLQLSLGDADPQPAGSTAKDPAGAAQRAVLTDALEEALAVAALVPAQVARLDAEGLRRLHDEVERPLVRVLAKMEVAGIRVDATELRRIADDLTTQTHALMGEIHELAGHEFNVNSTPQLRTVLYDELGLAPGRKTKTGYSTDAATLETLRDVHPIVDTILRYREVEKLRSTYGESLLAEVAPDGRIHASFRQTVARTGRLSSERPNLHNIPTRTEIGAQFRKAFIPADGCRFLVADYDQVELRVIAHLSKDEGLVAAFTAGEDIHRTVAAGVYGVEPTAVTKEQRDRAKMVSYGLAYGMEAFGLSRRLSTTVEDANDIMNRYFDAFPSVRAYMDSTVVEARDRGYTRTQMGRKRPLPDLRAANFRTRSAAERQAMNAGIQGLAADLFKQALVRLDRALTGNHLASRTVLQIHDEVIVEAVADEESVVEGLTREALCGALDLAVPLEVSMAWGDSWAVKG